LEPSRESRSSHDPVEFYPQESPTDIQLHNHAVVVLVDANRALAQACAVCSPKTKVNECNGDITPTDFSPQVIEWTHYV